MSARLKALESLLQEVVKMRSLQKERRTQQIMEKTLDQEMKVDRLIRYYRIEKPNNQQKLF